MSAPPDPDLLEAIAVDLGVDPAYVEKDWYAMRLVAAMAGLEHGGIQPVFSGGTSLSKGYGLIKRFSEDLDFKLLLPSGEMGRGERRTYRSHVIESIRASGWKIDAANVHVRNEGRFFRCNIGYAHATPAAQALRPQIKLEVTFLPPALVPEARPLQSFVSQARGDAPEVVSIACVVPAETAADKLSALAWRVLTRDREAPDDDPTLVRHLHDLAVLERLATDRPDFPELFRVAAQGDGSRGATAADLAAMTPVERVDAAIDRLSKDPEYADEYSRFVLAMSYAPEDETPTFELALEAFGRLGGLVTARGAP